MSYSESMDTTYYSLEAVAGKLNLPRVYIRRMAEEKRIPYLVVGGRLRFNPSAVQSALDKIAQLKGGDDE